jgi:hypothetical protein
VKTRGGFEKWVDMVKGKFPFMVGLEIILVASRDEKVASQGK